MSAVPGNFDAINREAFERYLLDLVRNSAVEEERLYREAKGEDLHILIRDAELQGSYPNTVIRFRRYERARDIEDWTALPIWTDATFFDQETGERRMPPEKIAGDILMLARGG